MFTFQNQPHLLVHPSFLIQLFCFLDNIYNLYPQYNWTNGNNANLLSSKQAGGGQVTWKLALLKKLQSAEKVAEQNY